VETKTKKWNLAAPVAALLAQPPGQLGYEGQPGNQGGY
jgi:hypothetical protein